MFAVVRVIFDDCPFQMTPPAYCYTWGAAGRSIPANSGLCAASRLRFLLISSPLAS
jgi:hypothetical protein